ncbi:MAG: hypothetical protein JWN14_447 [Chthonomonadales bacterium]|nr:hypothetical protein [Chthonomonadales bacterium]
MADLKQKTQGHQTEEDKESGTGFGKSGGNMGAGKSGKENMGTEKPGDIDGQGSQKPGGDHDNNKRAHDDKTSARGGGSNQNRDKGGVETDATGGRRAKHNDDEDKYGGRGTGKN